MMTFMVDLILILVEMRMMRRKGGKEKGRAEGRRGIGRRDINLLHPVYLSFSQ